MDELMDRAEKIAVTLQDAGHEAYFAGGCVRDYLLGREPADIDIATSATPEQVERIFRRTIAVGKQFGVIIVVDGKRQFDVATFRSDGAYGDHRRPDDVRFTSAEEDVRRRDFTINGLFMNPRDRTVIDFVDGKRDLEAGVVRTIGDPDARFDEDRLRILRAVRFAARLGFEIDGATKQAIKRRASQAADPSPERVNAELSKCWTEGAPARAFRMLDELDLVETVLPEVAAKKGMSLPARLCPDGSDLDGFERTRALLDTVAGEPVDLAVVWALVLGDLVPGDSRLSSRAAVTVLRRLANSKAIMSDVALLVGCRDRALFAREPSHARRRLAAAHPRRDLMAAHARIEARVASEASVAWSPDRIPEAAELPPPLLRGDELAELGVPRGRRTGQVLARLRFYQLEGRLDSAADARAWIASRRGREGQDPR